MTLISCKDDDDPSPLGEYIDCNGRAGNYIIKKDGGILSLDVLNQDFKRNYVFEKKSKGVYSNSGGQLTLMYDKAKKHFIIIAQGEGSVTLCKIKDVTGTNSSIKTETRQANTVVSPDDKDTLYEGEPEYGRTSAKTPDVSGKDVGKIVDASKDHATLLAALKKAGYLNDLSTMGPITLFAPTNDAFNKLPAGTVEELMKDVKEADLKNTMAYHIALGVFKTENMQEGQKISMANSQGVTLSVRDGKIVVNGTANIVASIPASNGIIHVIDAVLLPPVQN